MATILITGGTGLVGTRLTEILITAHHEVIVLTRTPGNHRSSHGVHFALWDIGKQYIDPDAIAKADHIIHLAGAGVIDKRWSKNRKQEILESRTRSSALIVKALQEIPNHVRTVASASAIGWYGPDTEQSRQHGFTEEAPADDHFLGETCRLWEESIRPVELLGKKLVIFRSGIVLSPHGGALEAFRKPLRTGIAAILGNGRQVISWIHIDDLCQMYITALDNNAWHGVYNAVAPHPITNRELTLTLARKIRGRYFLPVHIPAFLLKIVMGEMSVEVLKSTTVSSGKIQSSGFEFTCSNISEALRQSVTYRELS